MEILKPFSPHSSSLQLRGKIALELQSGGSRLTFRFDLSDPERLVLDSLPSHPLTSDPPVRVDGLWKTTCFEAFWALPAASSYWELNLSPSGRTWNLYSFEGYREPQPPRESHDFELRNLLVAEDHLICVLDSKLKIDELEGALTAVIRTASGTHYYSTCHAGSKPDFHLRSGFTIHKTSL